MIVLDCTLARFMGLGPKTYLAVATQLDPWRLGVGVALSPWWVIRMSWIVFAVVWFVAALNRKRTDHRDPLQRRLFYVLFMTAAFFLLVGYFAPTGFLERRAWPDAFWIAQVGATLTAAGIAFAIWARVHIGRNWSGQVMIKQDHELIRTGPYSRIRHPIYTGLLLALLGTAFAMGQYRAILGFVLIAVGFIYKAKREEQLLTEHFGPAFDEHKRHTGFFLPRLS
jgi:protein-S-isoprenylcysteine O-methyltransferase Ste14